MDILKEIIYEQNKEMLTRIANDKYNHDAEKDKFMKKYLKKNFTHIKVVRKDPTPKYEKSMKRLLIRCVK
tara:strand:- start:65 stop:274 length:210 start_codon:yes stop_codon:yes gene_type:complete